MIGGPWAPDDPVVVICVDPDGLATVWTQVDEASVVALLTAVLAHAVTHGGPPTPRRRHTTIRRHSPN